MAGNQLGLGGGMYGYVLGLNQDEDRWARAEIRHQVDRVIYELAGGPA